MPASVGWVWLIVVLPFAGFVANGLLAFLRPNSKNLVSGIGVGVLVASLLVSIYVISGVTSEEHGISHVVYYWSWMPVGDLQIDLGFLVDRLSAVMMLVVTGVGALIHVFSVGYMKSDPGYARYFSYLNLFVFFMLVLVLGSSFPVMFVGWEGVGLCSYLLIGFWYSEKVNADAGKKAFIMNRIGDFGFLVAMFMIFDAVGSLELREVFLSAPLTFEIGGATVTAITLLLFLGCVGKSAQIPLYTWLPDAMAGPTPVSALIHAATMVTAGVYLVARSNVLFAMAPLSSLVVAMVGAVTALFAATIAMKQWDIKKVLAYSTISQLGYMFMGVGAGAYAAGIFHLVTHAFFKALLFLGAGSVIHVLHHAYHQTHSGDDAQDMRNMGGLRRYMPWTTALMWIATLAIAGIPPLSGFFSKDEILAQTFSRGHDIPLMYLVWALGAVAALLTAFYMTRMMIYTFHGANRTGEHERGHLREAPWIMTGPLVLLGVGSVLGGVLNLPDMLPLSGWLHHWLEPTTISAKRYLIDTHLSAGTQWGLLAAATGIAIVGMVVAFRVLKPTNLTTPAQAPEAKGIQRLLANKYYIDQLYDTLVVRPLVWMSDKLLWRNVDDRAIDGLAVNGWANISRFIGWVGTKFQSGQVSTYVVIFVIGVIFLLRSIGQ